MPPHEPSTNHLPSRTRRWAVILFRCTAWTLRGLLLLAGLTAAASPKLIDTDWRFDFVATLIAQCSLVLLLLALWQILFRRWIWCSLFAVTAAACFSWVLLVERAPFEAASEFDDAMMIRVLQMNMFSRNDRTDEIFDLIRQHEPQVVVIVEASAALLKQIDSQADLLADYPHRALPADTDPGQILVLSTHHLSGKSNNPLSPGLHESWGYRAGFMRVDDIVLRFAAVHAPSPRTEMTWNFGQNTFDRLGSYFSQFGEPMRESSVPSLIVGDLNCSPTSARSLRVTRDLGLLRAKPLWKWDGTFPASMPWLARTPIDGAMVSPGITVHRWETVRVPGSDHRGVLIELSISAVDSD